MKRNIFIWALILMLTLLFALPAQAAGNYVTDEADILTPEEEEMLEALAEGISDSYDFGVYIMTVEDYWDYASGDAFDAAHWIYAERDLGRGDDHDGVMLLLSMEDRDYCLYTYGDYGNYAFTDGGREAMTEYFLDDFRYDDWQSGFADYLSSCEDYLEAAQQGMPYDYELSNGGSRGGKILLRFAIILLLPLIIAFVVITVLKAKMRSVAKAREAAAYVVGDLVLTGYCYDRYTHTTESRVKVSSSSSGSSRSSGGGSGTVGKF